MEALLSLIGLRKSFGEVRALVWPPEEDLVLAKGEILGLVGENGAGKSTLMASLVGSVQLDAGRIELDGAAYRPVGPFDALRLGVALIPQESMLSPTLTVAENVLMGRERDYAPGIGLIRRRQRDALARRALDELGLDLDTRTLVGDLPFHQQKLIELARALAAKPAVLLVDEASNALPRAGAELLFERIRLHAGTGGGVVHVTHHLGEVMQHCSRVAVLRDGALVAVRPTSETDEDELSRLMVGRELSSSLRTRPRRRHRGSALLEVRNVNTGDCTDISLAVGEGEIVGIGGLSGCGSQSVARVAVGDLPARRGQVLVGSTAVRRPTVRGMLRRGVGYVPQDRELEGLILGATVGENMLLLQLERVARGGFVLPGAGARVVRDSIRRLAIKPPVPTTRVTNLSGGNRQKVLLARYLLCDLDVLVLDNPTRGVDVGAKAEIYALLEEVRAQGKGILMLSDELPELLRICDRIIVMRRGRVSAEHDAPLPTEEELIGEML